MCIWEKVFLGKEIQFVGALKASSRAVTSMVHISTDEKTPSFTFLQNNPAEIPGA